MHPYRSFCCLSLALAVCTGLEVRASQAASFTISIDTTALANQASPPVPFALDLQLLDGDGTVTNTVTLSDFGFGAGGSPLGSPSVEGGASGELASTVTLTDSAGLNELIQSFTPSSTQPLQFLLTTSTHVEPFIPDAFSLAILDRDGVGLPTAFFDVFVQLDISSPLRLTTYASTGDLTIPQPIVMPTPEPSTLGLVVLGLVGSYVCRRGKGKRSSRAAAANRPSRRRGAKTERTEGVGASPPQP